MKTLLIFLPAILLFFNFPPDNPLTPDLDWVSEVGAKQIPQGQSMFNVADFDAPNDGKKMATPMIQAAIDACAAKGGGIVTFNPGQYLTGSLFLKAGVHLQIPEGTTLLGSQHIEDYPEIDTRVAGLEMRWPAALINVIGQKNVAVSGKGTVNAQGKPFWDMYWDLRKEYEPKGLRWIVDYDAKRPRTILVSESSDVTLRDITLQQAGFWTVHILYSDHITANGLVIRNNIGGHGPSTDGIDIDSSTYILVEHCDIDCNDDNFCLKAGRDADGLRVDKPTEYVVIRDCISRAGGGLVTFGSETSGSIRHVLAQNLEAKGTGVGIRFKSAMTRGGTVEDIYVDNVTMDGVNIPIEASLNWNPSYSYSTLPDGYNYEDIPRHWKVMLEKVEPEEKGIPTFQNVHIENIKVKNANQAIVASGAEVSPLKGFHFSDIYIQAKTAGTMERTQDFTFDDMHIDTKDGSKLLP